MIDRGFLFTRHFQRSARLLMRQRLQMKFPNRIRVCARKRPDTETRRAVLPDRRSVVRARTRARVGGTRRVASCSTGGGHLRMRAQAVGVRSPEWMSAAMPSAARSAVSWIELREVGMTRCGLGVAVPEELANHW